MSSEDIVNFQSSKLGTKEYWDDCYDLENENFDDHGEEGGSGATAVAGKVHNTLEHVWIWRRLKQ